MIIKKNSQKYRDAVVDNEMQGSGEADAENYADNGTTADSNQQNEGKIDIFNLENIDFKQRQERRRGDRRRGFRRIDDRNLISRAKEEAVSIKEAASKEGYEAGIQQAKSDIEEVKNAITTFMGAKQEVFDSIVPNIMNISLDIAKKIIKKEVEQNPIIILDEISELLKRLSKEETKITLKVNPVQVSLVKSEIPEMVSNAGLDAKVLVVPDDTIMEGGCIVTTTNGVIDATIETQLSVISEALKGL